MHGYLAQHPDVYMSRRKESLHFATDLIPEDDWFRDRAHYFELFAGASDEKVVGESSGWVDRAELEVRTRPPLPEELRAELKQRFERRVEDHRAVLGPVKRLQTRQPPLPGYTRSRAVGFFIHFVRPARSRVAYRFQPRSASRSFGCGPSSSTRSSPE